ncbi:MAG: enoyl-CoA hydratase/isomerase family protein [Comamonas sp.]
MAGQVLAMPLEGEGMAQVLRVVLRHPGRLNAMSRAMWRELRSVFESVQRRQDLRCVLIEGEDEAFCAGGDISEYPGFRFTPEGLAAFHDGEVWPALQAMLDCDVPLVAHIRGACMGAGVEIASCCDLRLAADDARFGAPIAKLGFPMAPREAALVARAVGDMKARQMLLEAAVFSAGEMAQAGFLSRVLPAAGLAADVLATVRRVARLAPGAARLNKRTLRALGQGAAVPEPYAYAGSAEHHEGITAFLDKRAPRF